MRFDQDRLYALLPAVYRARDAEAGYPLKALIGVIAEQVRVLQEDLDQLYDDQFVETCAEWVVPYIGDLIGYRSVNALREAPLEPTRKRKLSERAQLANTMAYRRRKGTAAALEQVARDVTGWEANVVEYFKRLSVSQHVNHVRSDSALPDLRDWQALEVVPTPFDRLPHTADLRRMSGRRSIRGRYNIPNVGIFLWRIQAYPIFQSLARESEMDRGFRFSPLGHDMALFAKPQSEPSFEHLATHRNVARPLGRVLLHRHLDAYYGPGESQSLAIFAKETDDHDHRLVSREEIVVCNLKGWEDTNRLPTDKFAIDPELGRLTRPVGWSSDIRVTFHYGFSGDLGGGSYDRTAGLATSPNVHRVPVEHAGIESVVNALTSADNAEDRSRGALVSIEDSNRYPVGNDLHLVAGRKLVIQASSGHRPAVALGGERRVSGDTDSTLVLNGLLITGGPLRITGKLRRLTLRHCTLVPGLGLTWDGGPLQADAPSLIVEGLDVEISIEHCIVGGVRTQESARIVCRNSIVDATTPDGLALGGLDGSVYGGQLDLRNVTVIGRVYAHAFELASNCLFVAESATQPPVQSVRLQTGCVRASFLPPDSKVPPRFRCQPATSSLVDRVWPHFVSLRYGEPGYCQLRSSCPTEISSGADDGAEMGAFHDLYQSLRLSNLDVRLREHLPLALERGIFFAS